MSLPLRPPVLRAGSLDASRLPSRMGSRLVHTAEASTFVQEERQRLRDAALAEVQRLVAQWHITAAELAAP